MATLETQIESDGTVHHILSGDLTVDELVDMMIVFSEAPSPKSIWNITNTKPVNFDAVNINKGVSTIAPHSMKHAGRRIAIVGETDMSFGIARMILSWAQRPDPVNAEKVFRRVDEALEWLNA